MMQRRQTRSELWNLVWRAVEAAATERGVRFGPLGEEITRLYARRTAARLAQLVGPEPAELERTLADLRELVHRMADHAGDREIDTRAHGLARAELRPRSACLRALGE